MKSKITKIQKILTKGIAVFAAGMMLASPMLYAVTSLDDGYLESSWFDKLLYGSIGSTAKEIEEYFDSGETTLYIQNETQLRALAEYVNDGHECYRKEIILLNDIELDKNNEWMPIGNEDSVFKGKFNFNGHVISGLPDLTEEQDSIIDVIFGGIGSDSIIIEGNTINTQIEKVINEEKGLVATYTILNGYYKADNIIEVQVTFNKKLYTALGTSDTKVNEETAPKLTLKIGNEYLNFETDHVNINEDKTIVDYKITVTDDMINGKATQLRLQHNATYYAIEGDIPTNTTEYLNYKITSIGDTVDLNSYSINIDTVKPTINTKVYVENMLETERYTAGKEILFEVTTSETIQGDYTTPQIQVSFSKSDLGKYNYTKDPVTVGYAKCKSAQINLDGTTTWIYSYQVQERDEGQLEFSYKAGEIRDLAENVTNIKDLYTPSAEIPESSNIKGNEWSPDLGVTYEFYKNFVSESNKVTSQTYFTNTDDLIVVATYDKVLYVVYGDVNKDYACIPFSPDYKNNLPTLYFNGDKSISSKAYEMSTTNEIKTNKVTEVRYKFVDIAENEYLDELTLLSKVVLKNENNTSKENIGGGDYTLGGNILYSAEYYDEYHQENRDNLKIIEKDDIKTTSELDDVIIDPIGVSDKIEDFTIYADTTAPTVTIVADKSNPTNADLIKYTFKFSEVVEGFTADDITVVGGEKVTQTVGEGEEAKEEVKFVEVVKGLEYTLEVKPTISVGNMGELKAIVEEGACTDLVAINNVRQESTIIVDKKAPTVEIKANKEIVTDGTITYEFIWSEAVKDFTAEDITVNNGEKGEFSGEGNYYTLEVLATNGNDLEVNIEADKCTDIAGNNNIASNKHVIAVAPTVTITTNTTSNATNVSEIEYTFTWSEEVNGFEAKDIILPEGVTGTLSDVTVNDDGTYSYKMVVNYNSLVPAGNEGEVTVAVVEKAVKDVNGNENAYTTNTLKIDRIAPIFISLEAYAESNIALNKEVDTVKEYYKVGDIVKIVATFSENIEATTKVPELALQFSESGNAKGTISGENIDKSGNKITYTYTITNNDKGTLSVKGFVGTVKDAAGNETKVAKKVLDGNTIIADTAAPNLLELKVTSTKEANKSGESITIEAVYDEEIYALIPKEENKKEVVKISNENAPKLDISFGGVAAKGEMTAKYATKEDGTPDKTRIIYTYIVKGEEEEGDNGELSIDKLENLTNSEVCDIAGNTSYNTTNNKTTNDVYADTIKPEVESITADGSGYEHGNIKFFKEGTKINVTIKSDEPIATDVITVLYAFGDEMPTEFKIDTEGHLINDESEYTFTVTVEDGENGFLWVKVGDNVYTDKAGNGNIKYNEGNAYKISNIYADTEAPRLSTNEDGKSEWKVEYDKNDADIAVGIKAKGIFNEKVFSMSENSLVALKDIPTFGVTINGELVEKIEPKPNNPTISIQENNKETSLDDQTVLEYYMDIRHIDTKGNPSGNFINGTVYDRAGNKMTIDLMDGDLSSPIFKDIKVLTSNDFYNEGKEIEIIARFEEQIKLDKIPKLTIKLGDKTEELEGSYNANDIYNTDTIKVARYTYRIKDTDAKEVNEELNIISLIGTVSDGVRPREISQIYIDTKEDEINDVNGKPEELLNSYNQQYANNDTEYENVIADNITPYISSVEVRVPGKENLVATYTQKDAITKVGKLNVNEFEYVITFSEPIEYINESAIKLYNAEKVDVKYHYTSAIHGHYDKITIKAKTTTEGVQSLIFNEGIFADRAGNTNENIERFNMVTTDFTKPTVRFISEYNGGVYVLPTNIDKVEIRPNIEISEDIETVEYKWSKVNDKGEFIEDITEYAGINNYSSSSDIAVPTKVFTVEGNYQLSIKVVDLAGNDRVASKVYKIAKEKITISADVTEYTNEPVTVTVSFGDNLTDNRKVTFKPKGSNDIVELNAIGIDKNGNTQYSITENGTVYAEATDKVGNKVFTIDNKDGESYPLEIRYIDTVDPEINIKINGANLVIGTGKDKAVIKTEVETSDNKIVEEAKYVFLQDDIDISGYKNKTEEEKTVIKTKIVNTLQDEVQIEAISTKDKPYYLYVLAVDAAGNERIVKSNPFTVVDTNPGKTTTTVEGENGPEEKEEIIPAEKPVEQLIIFEQEKEDIKDIAYVSVNYDYSIIKNAKITLENETYGFGDYEFEPYKYNNIELYGNTTIIVEAWDACGNEVRHEYKVEDIVGPEFTITGNPEGWTNGDVELEVYSNAKLKTLTLNGENILGDNKYRVNKVIDKYGEYTFEATDIYNNTSEQTIEVKIDKSRPEITNVDIQGGKIVITANDIDKTLNRELSGLAEYAITDTTEVPLEWSTSNEINVVKDANFFVWVKDNAGNITMKEEIVVRDITAPELTITTDTELDKWTNTDIKVDVKSNEELSSLVIKYTEMEEKDVEVQEGETPRKELVPVDKEVNILETGTYTITSNKTYEVIAVDKSGNETKETINVTKIDKTLPEISENDTTVNGRDITISATDDLSRIEAYAVTSTTEEPAKWSASNVIKVTKDGTYYVWAKDKAGNITMSPKAVVVDTVVLEIEVTGNTTDWTNEGIELTVKANKELSSLKMVSTKVVVNAETGEETIEYPETEISLLNPKVVISENGEYKFVATDKNGNPAEETVEITTIDKVAPQIPETGVTVNGNNITITATDNEGGAGIAKYAITSTTEVPVEWSESNTIKVTEDGIFYAWVKDNAGNISRAENVVVIDTTAPTITFNYLSQTITVGMPLEAYILTDENATISYSWDNENWVDSQEKLTSLKVSEKSTTIGKSTLYVKATDEAGNESEVQILEFNVVNMEEIKEPAIVFEDIPTVQINGVRYVKISSDMTADLLTDKMNKEALCGKTPEYTKLTEEGTLRTGSEIAINGSTKYVVIVNGDVNGDGSVTFLGDVVMANNYRIGQVNLTIMQMLAADINNSGNIEFIQDIIAMNNYRLGIISSL